jgi:alginate O-acetyltransferase complex protein AlgJ
MSTPQQPLPSGGPSREALAVMEIEHTLVSPATVRFLVAFFLTAICLVPLLEIGLPPGPDGEGVRSAFSRLADAGGQARLAFGAETSAWPRISSWNRVMMGGLSDFERALEDESLIARSLRPPAQALITAWLGAGNERVYPGRERWLFYRPDVEYLTGRAFLEPAQLARRVREAPVSAAPPEPDPLPAILRFNQDLRARGITLILMPTPQKPGVHPDKLASAYGAAPPTLKNPSFETFVGRLDQEGVLVFEPTDSFSTVGRDAPRYLETDTHWRPEAMKTVAEELSRFIAARVSLPGVGAPGFRVERVDVSNVGDTARMLDLPDDVTLFPPETVAISRVLQRDGSLWRPARTADVLVLGDSFSNIYTLESMGWGTSAGFVEQLSYALSRPVDRLVQNDEGAFATRAMLQRDVRRLEGKRVVVYQFAERELAFGDWKLLGLPQTATP